MRVLGKADSSPALTTQPGLANIDRKQLGRPAGLTWRASHARQLTTAMVSLLPFLLLDPIRANAQDIEGFAILAGQSITNTGPTTIVGDIGISPGSTYTGSGSVTQTGTTYIGEEVALRIQNDLTTLYNVLAGRPTSANGNLTGQDLGGLTLRPGVYNFDTSAGLATGQTLVLDARGDPNAIFVFNIGTTLTVGSGARIQLINGAQGGNVFYRVGSSATIDTSAVVEGQIVALTSISLLTSAMINCGAALARNGSVTLDTNTIRVCRLTGVSFVDAVNGVIPDDGDDDDGDDDDDDDGGDDDGGDDDDDDGGDDDGPGGETASPTRNVEAVAIALDEFVENGGVLPVSFAILAAALTPEELAEALAQLSGEVATGVAPSAFRSTDLFLDRLLGGRTGPGTYVAPAATPAPIAPATVSVLGYAPVPGSADERAQMPFPAAGLTPRPWDMWVAAIGGYNTTDGDDHIGNHERRADQFGIALGVDYYVTPDTTVGLAVGKTRTNFEVSQDFGDGGGDTLHAAAYARMRHEAAYFTGALAYGYNDMWTDRTVTIGGNDRFTADFSAHTVAGHVEAGYTVGWITPYAGLRGQVFIAPDYSERAASGVSTFALDYESRTATSLRTELGAQIQFSTPLWERALLDVRLRGAWARELGADNDVDASFQFLGEGSEFTVSGATADRDSLLMSAGGELSVEDGFYIAGSLDARLSQNAQTYGGALKVGMRW